MFKSIRRLLSKTAAEARRPSTDPAVELGIEPLENRQMLAGNVTAVMRGGDLIIRGDKLSNNIDIVPINNGVRVIGRADPNGAATTVNGFNSFDFGGSNFVQDDVKIVMGKGRDRVGLFVAVNDDVSINLGPNSDDVDVTSVIGGRLTVSTGSADNLIPDFVDIVNTSVADVTRVSGGGGTQQLFVANSAFFSTSTFNLGGGDDIMQVTGSGFNRLRANGGSGRFDQFAAPFAAISPEVRGFEVIV